MVSAPTLEEFVDLCSDFDDWHTPRWYHREILAWYQRCQQCCIDIGKASRWRTLSTAPDWPNDFLSRVQDDLAGERVTLLVMDDLVEPTPAYPPTAHPKVEPLRARVSVDTLMLCEHGGAA